MKLSSVITVALSLSLGSIAAKAVTPAELYLTLSVEQVFERDEPARYLAFPGLSVYDNEYTYQIGTYSPTDAFRGFVNNPEVGSSSVLFNDLDSLRSELSGQWQLVFGVGTELAEMYFYDVDAFYLSESNFPSFELVQPMNGATGLSANGFAATWTAPEDIAFAEISLFRGNQFIDYYFLEPGQTSLTVDNLELEPGEYELNLSIYYTDITEISIGAPYNPYEVYALAVDGPPFQWIAGNQLRLQDRNFFTVVPEPSHYAALAGLIALLGLLGRRLRNK